MKAAATWVVIPGYNEQSEIARTVRSVSRWLPNVVVVDDGSTDATSLRAAIAGAHVVRHAINLGQGAALMTGVKFALLHGADNIVTFDADGQHRPQDIDALIEAAHRTNADVVLGSRFLGAGVNMPNSRRWLLVAAAAYTRWTTGLRVTDAHNGLRLLTRRAAERLRIRQNRMAHASELMTWLATEKFRVVEVPVHIVYTEYSLAKGQSLFSSFNILWDLWSGKLHR